MSVLIFTPNGGYVTKLALADAATSPDVANKVVMVTSPQVVTTIIAWPTDRDIQFSKNGYVTFTGVGALTGLKEARPEWFGAVINDASKGAVNKVALQAALMTQAPVTLAKGIYYTDAGIVLSGNNFKMSGSGMYTTTIQATTNVVADMFSFSATSGTSVGSSDFQNFAVVGNSTVGYGFTMGSTNVSEYSVMNSFTRCRVTGFTQTGKGAFNLVRTWWFTISGGLIDGNYNAFTVPASAVITTAMISDNAEITSNTHDAISVASTAIVHEFISRNASFEANAHTVLSSTANNARYIFEKCYFEQNCTAAGSAQFVVTDTSNTRLTSAYLACNECTSDTPLSSKILDVDYCYLRVVDCASFNASTIITTANSHAQFYRMNGTSSGDFLTTAASLLGDIYVEDFITAENKRALYQSNGNLFINHIGSRGTAPTLTAGASGGGAGFAASVLAGTNATDTKGTISYTPGASASGGPWIKVTFAKAYAKPPAVILTYGTQDVSAPALWANSTTGYFEIGGSNAPVAGLKYIHYLVIE